MKEDIIELLEKAQKFTDEIDPFDENAYSKNADLQRNVSNLLQLSIVKLENEEE